MGVKLLIIDADQHSRRMTAELLKADGYQVAEEQDGGRWSARAAQHKAGLVIVAEDALPSLRGVTSAPIIVVGAGGEMGCVKALLQGADAYLTKPVCPQELLSRVRALCRRAGAAHSPVPATERNAQEESLPGALRSSLTETETRLLRCLMERPGHLVGHRELMTRVWGGPVNQTRLRFYIHSLRRKLSGAMSFSLYTQKGVGYRLVPAAASGREV